jgi:hypothetical protein
MAWTGAVTVPPRRRRDRLAMVTPAASTDAAPAAEASLVVAEPAGARSAPWPALEAPAP